MISFPGFRISRFLDPLFWRSLGVNRTVFALSMARMADGIGNTILFIVIPLYVVKMHSGILHLPDTILIGILISLYGFANAALQPLVAILADRVGHYKLFIQAGLVMLAAATFSFAFAGRYMDLVVLRVVQGFGLAMEIPPTMAILTIVTQVQTRGGAMGFYTTARMLGLAAGPLIGGLLYDYFGFNATFYAGTGILLLAIVVVQLGVGRVSPPRRESDAQRRRVVDTSLFNAGILSAAFATLLMAGAFTLVSTLENEFQSRLDIGAFGFSLAFSSLMISRLLVQVPFGRLSDRIGRKPLVLAGMLLLAPVTALLGEVETLWEFIGLRLIQGIAAAAIMAPALAYAGDLAQAKGGGREGRQTSVVTIGFSLGIALGPLMAGFLAAVFFELPFWVEGALCGLGSIVVFFFMSETVRKGR